MINSNTNKNTNNLEGTDYEVILHDFNNLLKKQKIAHGTYILEIAMRGGKPYRYTVSQTISTLVDN